MDEVVAHVISIGIGLLIGLWIGHYWGVKSMMPIVNDYKSIVSDLQGIITRNRKTMETILVSTNELLERLNVANK